MSSYRIERTEEGCRLTVNGGLTAILVPELQKALKQELAGGIQQVTFDLAETSMLDSSGIGLLIAASNSLSRKNSKLAVVNADPDIFRLLTSMRLVSRLNVRPVEQDHE